MSMETDRKERDVALETFANAAPREANAVAPAGMFREVSAERVYGAQAVAVYRDEGRILQKLKTLAAAAGDHWYYRFPVKSDGKTAFVEGASIKLANDLARIYGNCDVDTRVMDLHDSWVFYARFTDYETGFSMTRAFQQRKNQKSMKGDPDRARDIVFQIGQSKAIRNVVVNALQTYSDYAFEEARNSLVDKIGKSLPLYRERLPARFKEINCDIGRVEIVMGRAAADWLAPDVAKILAMMKAVSDGMATLDETFPPLDGEKTTDEQAKAAMAKSTNEKLDAIIGKNSDATASAPVEPSDEADDSVFSHDADTGEIIDREIPQGVDEAAGAAVVAADAELPAKDAGSESGTGSASGGADEADADPLLDKARGRATQGKRKLSMFLNTLSVADRDRLRPHDAALFAMAEAADKAK